MRTSGENRNVMVHMLDKVPMVTLVRCGDGEKETNVENEAAKVEKRGKRQNKTESPSLFTNDNETCRPCSTKTARAVLAEVLCLLHLL